MSLYYFHLVDGTDVLLDPEGRELEADAIASVAFTEARGILSADAGLGQLRLDQMLEIQDEGGAVVHRLQFADALEIRWPEPR